MLQCFVFFGSVHFQTMNSFSGQSTLYSLEKETASLYEMDFQGSRLTPEPKRLLYLICGASFSNLSNQISVKVLLS